MVTMIVNIYLNEINMYFTIIYVLISRLDSGGEFLFQAHDDSEMNNWISNINSHTDADSSGPSRSQTLPASAQKEDSKRRSFFTLKKT